MKAQKPCTSRHPYSVTAFSDGLKPQPRPSENVCGSPSAAPLFIPANGSTGGTAHPKAV
ncbi:hypothetical protein [Kingella potus]|uniref:hypothetical protein n=1 Tax=Kingella potus TaxID=265175 RepID=UPI001FD1222B|nr:hypothetical protein [Kingella potus]UOP01168.1 hypothetical protein LVJ84_02295 [Kingella potus]